MSGPNVEQLFARTLEGAYDDDEPWEAVHTLRLLGTRDVFELAAQWCASSDPLKRARGADVIAQLGKTVEWRCNSFPDDSFSVISRMLREEQEIRPLTSAIVALGHLDNPSGIPLIRPYEAHPSSLVRDAVAFALGCYPNETKAIQGLIKLTADVDEDVRDWATFGLGVLGDGDTAEIRDALAARLSDVNIDAREEAVVALAKRKDCRVLSTLTEMLSQPEPGSRAFEAASLMLGIEQNDPELHGLHYIAALNERFS